MQDLNLSSVDHKAKHFLKKTFKKKHIPENRSIAVSQHISSLLHEMPRGPQPSKTKEKMKKTENAMDKKIKLEAKKEELKAETPQGRRKSRRSSQERGGQRTADKPCPTKTLSIRGDMESDQVHVPAKRSLFRHRKRLNPRTS